MLAGEHHADGGVGLLDRELQPQHAVGQVLAHPVALVAEHLQHPGVVGQHVGDEPLQPTLPSRLREVLEEQLPEAATLVRVLDEERDLGLPVVNGVVAANSDDLVAGGDHQPHPAVVVDGGEPLHVAGRQRRVRGEEPVVLRPLRHPVVEGDQPLGVASPDRAQPGRPAVEQHDVGLPLTQRDLGVGGHVPESSHPTGRSAATRLSGGSGGHQTHRT